MTRYNIDMHLHTHNSDGKCSPYEVIDIAVDRGVKTIVFTDHSGITYSSDIVNYANRRGVQIPLMGLEVSTIHKGKKYHILVYIRDSRNKELEQYLMYPTKVKNDVFIQIINALRDRGIPIPQVEDILRGVQKDGSSRHRDKWMLTRTLIANYVADSLGISIDEAKSMFSDGLYPSKRVIFIENDLAREEKYLPTLDVISKMKGYGAGVILAHPWWECGHDNTIDNVTAHVREFALAGLHGIEGYSYHSSSEYDKATEQLCEMNPELSLIGGSDFHGDRRNEIGVRGVRQDHFDRFMSTISV